MKNVLLADLLRATAERGEGCPSEERWAALAGGETLPAGELEALEVHAATCPFCAAELDLAREFVAAAADERSAADGGVAPSVEVEAIVARLRAASPAVPGAVESVSTLPSRTAGGSRLLRFPSRPVARGRWLAGLAAAAAVIAAVGLLWTPGGVPPLGVPPIDQEMRGGVIDLDAPLGELAALPTELSWQAIAGAHSYRLELVRVDQTPLWETTGTANRVVLPPDVARRLGVAVRWSWRVTALDEAGAVVARSDWGSFSVRPASGAPAAPR